ncbi:hypothetical protein ACNFD4_11795 [Pseudomonas sp. NY15367]|nr:hypothetical protein [Pseudomonas sp. s4]
MSREREKDSTSDYRALDVRTMQRDGLLAGPWRGNWSWSRNGEQVASVGIETSREQIQLRYQSRRGGGEYVQYDYPVRITWTPCHLGGERPWFHCPSCGRRVAKLYGGGVFACRHCMRLNYRSQQVSKRDRALDRAWALRRKLGTDSGPFDLPAEYLARPKGMHRKTFARHVEKLAQMEAEVFAAYAKTIRLIEARLGRVRLKD